MNLLSKHIAGKLEILGSSRNTKRVGNSVEYAHILFSSSRNDDRQMMEEIVVGNLLNSYIRPGLEGDFYFVEFDDQKYLVGLKIRSRQIFDQDLFQEILPIGERESESLAKNNKTISNLLYFSPIIRKIFIIALLAVLLFPPIVIIIAPLWLSIEICFDQMTKKMCEKNQKIADEIQRSTNLSLREMEKIMEYSV
jgi:hypothetical protein